MENACTMLQSEAKGLLGGDQKTAGLGDNIEIAVDGGKACVGVASRIIGGGSHDDPARDIGEVAVAQEFGSTVTTPRSFLGAAAARRLDDVGSVLAEGFAGAFRRGLRGGADQRR
jgi:hypothetical protein